MTGSPSTRHNDSDRVHQNVDHPSDCAERGNSVKNAGEKSDITTKRNFNVRVKPAGERNATAGDRETGHEQNHRDRATNERKWSCLSQTFRHRRRKDENACADRGINNVRSQPGNADCADELMIDAARRVGSRSSPRPRMGGMVRDSGKARQEGS